MKKYICYAKLPNKCKEALFEFLYWANDEKQVSEFYENFRFKLQQVSVEDAKKMCMECNSFGFDSFEKYHEWYIGDRCIDVINHGDSIYPLILDGDDEWLADGWHRFHSYVKFYPNRMIPILTLKKLSS